MPIVMAKRELRIALDGKRGMKVGFGPTASVIVKLIEGQPPAWLKLIPKEDPVLKVMLFAPEFEAAVRRVSNVAHQGKEIVRLQFDNGSGIVSAKADGREVAANISVLEAKGDPNRFALNVNYLTEYLKNKDGIVTMTWTGGSAPVAFRHGKSPKVLIMPMQAQWDDELPKSQVKPEAKAAAPEEAAEAAPEAKTSKPQKQRGKKEKR